MGTFGTGRRCETGGWRSICRLDLNLHALVSKQVYTSTPIGSAFPIMPEDRNRADGHRMEQNADLARFYGGTPIPLALLAQRTGAATVDTGAIHDAQAPIGFSAMLMGC
jgi:hypothetical protein